MQEAIETGYQVFVSGLSRCGKASTSSSGSVGSDKLAKLVASQSAAAAPIVAAYKKICCRSNPWSGETIAESIQVGNPSALREERSARFESPGGSAVSVTDGEVLEARSVAARRQDLSPHRSAVREHVFLRTRVFADAWPHDHLSGHSARAVAGWAVRARLSVSPGELLRDDGRSGRSVPHSPHVGRRAHANGARIAERAGFRQEDCGDISPRLQRRAESAPAGK